MVNIPVLPEIGSKNIYYAVTYRVFYKAQAGELEIAKMKVKSTHIYRTGKYDNVYPPTLDFQFPDEGIRFYFDDEKLNHLTIRPSGTGKLLEVSCTVACND